MLINEADRKFECESVEEIDNESVRRDDLVELVLGPLGDQIDQARPEITSAVKEVKESMEIVAREVARQVKRRE